MSPHECAYYLADFSDEIVPCDCTLSGWADWLSKPDPDWGRDRAAADGDRFRATVLRFRDDIVATRGADGGWTFSGEVAPDAFVAVRYGPGLGWSADMILDPRSLAEWFGENDRDCEGVEHIAVAANDPPVMVTYRADPPRCVVEAIQ